MTEVEIRALNIDEVKSRLEALLEEIDAEDADLDALEDEQRMLHDREVELRKLAVKEQEERKAVIETAEPIEKMEEEIKMEERTFGIETVEYRNAWIKKLQNKELNEVEERAYATTDSHTAIPTLVADKFFIKLKKLAPMLNEITLMRVAGNLKFVAQGTDNTVTAHTENASVSAAADTIISVTLGAKEYVKILQISKNAETMSIDQFEDWLVEILSNDIAYAIDNAIINATSNGIAAISFVTTASGTTAKTQIVNGSGYTYKNILDLIALLPAYADADAKFLTNKATLYTDIASITNSSGTPIFVASPEEGMVGRIMGYPVIVDDFVSKTNKGLYLGKWSDVVGNLSKGIEVDRDESAGFATASICYRGYAAFDSKPAKTDCIVRLVSTTA